MSELGPETIRHALSLARDNGFGKVKIKVGAHRFSASLGPDANISPANNLTTAVVEVSGSDPGLGYVLSPAVGYVRLKDDGAKVGGTIEAGEVIGEVAALGLSNDIQSTVSGQVIEVMVEDGDQVEYGQEILKVALS